MSSLALTLAEFDAIADGARKLFNRQQAMLYEFTNRECYSLRRARQRADVSQRELADRAGVQQSVISRLESGCAGSIGVDALRRILEAYKDLSYGADSGAGDRVRSEGCVEDDSRS